MWMNFAYINLADGTFSCLSIYADGNHPALPLLSPSDHPLEPTYNIHMK